MNSIKISLAKCFKIKAFQNLKKFLNLNMFALSWKSHCLDFHVVDKKAQFHSHNSVVIYFICVCVYESGRESFVKKWIKIWLN